MVNQERRDLLGNIVKLAGASAVANLLPPSLARAFTIAADRRAGTIEDVEHIVVFTQENRGFDHYFGTMGGVRGFADPFPIPVQDRGAIKNKTVFVQPSKFLGSLQPLAPTHLDTIKRFDYMRAVGTPHSWKDAQEAWAHGRMCEWPKAKWDHAMSYFTASDIPFQRAMANAFTICDAYHCAIQAGTNPNRVFLWTGTNDPFAKGNGPVTYNDYDGFSGDPGKNGGYTWISYAERLDKAGVSWQIYQNMADNFSDNPLAGFRNFRDAWYQKPGYSQSLRDKGVTTRDLDLLKQDVINDRLPQVSWVIATAEGSEHPGPSSPAQGADYTARVLDALTANPSVWARTVLLINFDENDGYFDHVPPPAPPSKIAANKLSPIVQESGSYAGLSTVSTEGEYHEHLVSYHNDSQEQLLLGSPYGLGPRVPLYVISPWSKGGWVNSQVFDHTSIIRFIEARFGVSEPNISDWRRAVAGDLTSAFDFESPESPRISLPDTMERAARARALTTQPLPPTPATIVVPVQEFLIRPSRALPYDLISSAQVMSPQSIRLTFQNVGSAAAVFHTYNRLALAEIPRRYTVEAGKSIADDWDIPSSGIYDLWVLGPNGFHRHFIGHAPTETGGKSVQPEIAVSHDPANYALTMTLINNGPQDAEFVLKPLKYYTSEPSVHSVERFSMATISWPLDNGPWYDFKITLSQQKAFVRRFAGRLENGEDSVSDPAMGGTARLDQELVF